MMAVRVSVYLCACVCACCVLVCVLVCLCACCVVRWLPQVAGYQLRGLRCYFKASAGGVVCFDGETQCPDIVSPEYLTRAPGQGICQVPSRVHT